MSSNEKMVPERLAAPDMSTGHPSAGREFATAFYKERKRADALAGILAQKSEQPHGEPVALPARKAITAHGLTALDSEAEGWNACLDEIAKLGPLYARPIPAQGTAKPVGEVVGRRMEKFRFMPQVKWADDAQNGRTQPGTKLYTHADPGEAEQLRAELAVTKKLYAEASQASYDFGGTQLQIDTLHAQLAETHKLLKWFASCADVRQVGTVAMQKAAALSDSAEPGVKS